MLLIKIFCHDLNRSPDPFFLKQILQILTWFLLIKTKTDFVLLEHTLKILYIIRLSINKLILFPKTNQNFLVWTKKTVAKTLFKPILPKSKKLNTIFVDLNSISVFIIAPVTPYVFAIICNVCSKSIQLITVPSPFISVIIFEELNTLSTSLIVFPLAWIAFLKLSKLI